MTHSVVKMMYLGLALANRRPRKVRSWTDVGCFLNTIAPMARSEPGDSQTAGSNWRTSPTWYESNAGQRGWFEIIVRCGTINSLRPRYALGSGSFRRDSLSPQERRYRDFRGCRGVGYNELCPRGLYHE